LLLFGGHREESGYVSESLTWQQLIKTSVNPQQTHACATNSVANKKKFKTITDTF